ncbi:MAG: ATP synthase F1 subunit epsilon [Candidatus Falkowbacteria bacterium]|nr:ATP synthase F1 subunit epsilon [Candidatus Falkowbacteria bacterium]
MSPKTIKFEIVTPERVVLSQEILQITVPTTSGEITVLPDHIPLVSVLKPGVIEVKRADNSSEIISVSGGFIEVTKDKVVILADTAERAEELDEEMIKEAQQRAEKLKEEARNVDDVQFTAVAAKLEKEMARLRAVSRWRRLKGTDNK